MQDCALSGIVLSVAKRAQGCELLFQRPHRLESRADPSQMGVDQSIDVAAIAPWLPHEVQQSLHVRQRYVERPAMADERQPLQMRRTVGAVAVGQPGGLGKSPSRSQ